MLRRIILSPLLYIFVYVLAIPVFALLYCFALSSSFYAPYAHLEPAATTDIDRIARLINEALHRSVGSREVVIQEWKLQSFDVINARSSGETFDFDIMAAFKKQNEGNSPEDEQQQQTGMNLPVSILYGVEGLVGPRPDETANIMRQMNINISSHPASFQAFEMAVYNAMLPIPFFPTGRILILSRRENDVLNQFIEGVRGNPVLVNGSFERMLYFSATVITTIGFGDIVPMTPLARLLVALEGVCGVVLAGLFVNAIAQRSSHPSR